MPKSGEPFQKGVVTCQEEGAESAKTEKSTMSALWFSFSKLQMRKTIDCYMKSTSNHIPSVSEQECQIFKSVEVRKNVYLTVNN